MLYDDIRTGYYLRKWKYYEMARHGLRMKELENAKIFFHGLKRLSEADLKILADTYYESNQFRNMDQKTGYYLSVKPYSDEEMANKYHLSKSQFRNLRDKAQSNLKISMQKIMCELRSNFVYRIKKNLYLADIIDRGTSRERYVFGKEIDAMSFTGLDEDEVIHFMSLGFERVPINENKLK